MRRLVRINSMSLVSKNVKDVVIKGILFAALSVFATLSLYYIIEKTSIQSITVIGSCLLFIVFLLLSFVVIRNNKLTIIELVFASLISLICTYSYVEQGIISFVAIFIGFAYIFFLFKRSIDRLTEFSHTRSLTFVKKKTVIVATLLFLLASWMIYIVAYYPGIGFYDSLWQLSQFYGYSEFSSHHPVIASLIMGAITYIGSLISGDALFLSYVGLQLMLSLAFFTYITYSALDILQKDTKEGYIEINARNLVFYILLLVIFSFIPIFPLYSLTFTKDVLYTVALCFCMITLFKKYHGQKVSNWLLTISLFVIASFRKEGLIVTLVVAVIFIMCSSDKKKNAIKFTLFFVSLICINSLLGLFLHINPGSPIEMFALPDQQIALEVKEHEDSFTDKEIQDLNKMLVKHDYRILGEKFNTENADYVKMEFNAGRYSRKTIIRIWAHHLVLHPATFANAFLETTNGYFNPFITKFQGTFLDSLQWFNKDTTNSWKKTFGLPDNKLQPSNMGVNSDLRASLEQIYHYCLNNKTISWILSPAMYMWIFLSELCICFEQRKYRLLLICIPLLLVCGMCALAPINGSMRYALPIIYMSIALLPLIAYERQSKKD